MPFSGLGQAKKTEGKQMTTKVLELREKMATLATEARKELDSINDKTDSTRVAEIEGRFDAIMADHDKIGKEVEREERLAAAESRAVDAKRPVEDAKAEAEARQAAPEYKEVFEKQLRFGAASLDAEEREVLMSGRSEVRAQGTTPDSAGGYTVPEGFSGEIDTSLAAWGPMWDANIVRELTTSSGNALPWPTVDDTAKRGRIKAENAAVDDDGTDDVVFGEKVLNAYMYDTGMVRIPIELLQDSAFAMEPLLTDLFGERLGRTANEVLTTGTGSGQPNGIVTAASTGLTAASATAITSDELIDLFHSVDPAYRASPKCRWMFNDSTLAAIRKLKDGQGNYLWQMGDVRTGEPDMFLGKAYSVNQAMADIATGNSSVLFGDLSRYVVRKVRGFQVMTLRERYAENFQVGMVGFKRFDGELLNTSAVKKLVQL
jgi:HK97 family phage major capsid protein